MGLPLHNPSDSLNLSPGPTAPGGSTSPDSDADSDPTSELGCPDGSSSLNTYYRNTRITKYLRPSHSHSHQKRTRRHTHHRHPATQLQRARAPAAETHHVKPRQPWAADADEGAALARSEVWLPGDNIHSLDNGQGSTTSNSTTSSSSSSRSRSRGGAGSDGRRRPPSLERQDAFRDARTVKRRRVCDVEDYHRSPGLSPLYSPYATRDGREGVRMQKGEEEEIAELYRLGLLYDDEYERGSGFSLDRIAREEPVYAVRTRPARPTRRARMARNLELAGLAFSAFGQDEALAGWMASPSPSPLRREFDMAVSLAPLDTPRLTVIYELVDAPAADDFLDSVSEGYGGDAWAILEGGINGTDAVVEAMADGDDGDPWVVLGHDGS